MTQENGGFKDWAILELMGHRRLAGMVQEVALGGASMLRIDVPDADGETIATQFYSGAAVYCITPTTEKLARALALQSFSPPVTRYELPEPPQTKREGPDWLVCENCDARVPANSYLADTFRQDAEGTDLCAECFKELQEEGDEARADDHDGPISDLTTGENA